MADRLFLVTGACGFVGSHMVELLLSRGCDVRATDLELKSYIVNKPGVEFIKADITLKDTLKPLFENVDYVFHIAAIFDYWTPWQVLYKVNVEGTKNLCEIALDSDIKNMVIWSSGAVYGVPKEVPVKETAEIAPVNDYEKSKALQEKVALKFYREYGLPVTILRPASIYGPRSRYGTAILLFMLAKGWFPAIPGDGKSRPVLVHVRDVVGAAYFLCDKKRVIGEVFNIADDSRYTIEELLLAVAKMLNVKIYRFHIPVWMLYLLANLSECYARITGKRPLIEKESIRYLTFDSLMDNSKIKALGYKLVYPDALVGLKETIEWYRKVGWI